jgi:hypothetical protein
VAWAVTIEPSTATPSVAPTCRPALWIAEAMPVRAASTAATAVAATRTGMASAIHNAGRQVGATLGVAVLGSIVTAHATTGTATAYADGLSIALLVATTALVATAAITLKLVPRTRKARDSCTALGALDTPPR